MGWSEDIPSRLEVWERRKLPQRGPRHIIPRPKTILVLSRRDTTPLIVMSVMLFDKPENV